MKCSCSGGDAHPYSYSTSLRNIPRLQPLPQSKIRTHRATLVTAPYVLVEGTLQNQQGAISVKLRNVETLAFDTATPMSHDFR